MDAVKLVKKKERLWPVLYPSLPDIKANGQLGILMIGENLNSIKLQRWNQALSLNIIFVTKFSPGSFVSSSYFKP